MKTIEQLEQEAKQAREDFESLSNSLKQMSFALKENTLNLQNLSKVLSEASNQLLASSISLVTHEISGDGSGKALPEVSQEERDSDGWIEWNGGNQPTDDDTAVEVILRGGEESSDKAFTFYWRNDGVSSDIIAYRIVK